MKYSTELMIDKLLDKIFIQNSLELLTIKRTVRIKGPFRIFNSHLRHFASEKEIEKAEEHNKKYDKY